MFNRQCTTYLGGVGGGVGSELTVLALLTLVPLLDAATTAAAVGCDVLLLDDVLVAMTVVLVALATVVVAIDWDDFG